MSIPLDLNTSDCLLIEEHVPVVNLDTTEDEVDIPSQKVEAVKEKPFVQLVFQDATACKGLLDKIRRCVETYLRTQNKQIRVVADASGESVEMFADDQDKDGSIFTIDNKPSAKLKTIEIPAYQSSKKTLHNGELPEVSKKFRKAPMCYNCGGNHSVAECKLPRNADRIRRAKMQSHNKVERYHMDIEQKFAHLKPGTCSEKLKRALGVNRKHIPMFIYRMRLFGYPPGWLEEAKISHSGLNLFDSEGRNVADVGLGDNLRVKYNPEKIIDFPGFNVDPPPGYVDDSQLHGMPPMMQYHRKEVMFEMFGLEESQPGYKKKRLGELEAANGGTPPEVQDMEIEDGEVSPNVPFATNDESSQSSKDPEGNSQDTRSSPSLDDLQAAQERLLEALSANSPKNPEISAPEPPKTPDNRGKSLSTLPGTPILVPFSPYSNLPDGDNWAKGVSGVIDFENLPDSTGKYEKMKNVLEKVRETVCKIHKE